MDLLNLEEKRGFGIDATVSPDVIRVVAPAAEQAGYGSFWLNGSPPRGSLEGIAAAAESCSLPLGTGVLPLDRRAIEDVAEDVLKLNIPTDRFMMGIGYAKPRGALDYIRRSVEIIRDDLGATPIVGAFGPNMIELAGEVSDGVIFTFWFREAVVDGTKLFQASARSSNRPRLPVISYIRTALLPQAEQRYLEISDNYDSYSKFRALYAQYGTRAHDTVVTGSNRAEIMPEIIREEEVLDISIIRAITADESADSILELLEAAAPGD